MLLQLFVLLSKQLMGRCTGEDIMKFYSKNGSKLLLHSLLFQENGMYIVICLIARCVNIWVSLDCVVCFVQGLLHSVRHQWKVASHRYPSH